MLSLLLLLGLTAGCGAEVQQTGEAPQEAAAETAEEAAEEPAEAEPAESEPAAEEEAEPAAEEAAEVPAEPVLADGVYEAEFNTDSSMFHANEMCGGKGTLTVVNGEMTFHVSLASKSILNLYVGLAEDAQKESAVLLEPTVDTIDYNDGTTDEVYGFDIPVTVINGEFDLALIGKKGIWYDHRVSIDNPVPVENAED